jgi:hypothetical protein
MRATETCGLKYFLVSQMGCFRSAKLHSLHLPVQKKHHKGAIFCTPKVTIVERSQVEIEQFLAMLRFENRSKLEELLGFLK